MIFKRLRKRPSYEAISVDLQKQTKLAGKYRWLKGTIKFRTILIIKKMIKKYCIQLKLWITNLLHVPEYLDYQSEVDTQLRRLNKSGDIFLIKRRLENLKLFFPDINRFCSVWGSYVLHYYIEKNIVVLCSLIFTNCSVLVCQNVSLTN